MVELPAAEQVGAVVLIVGILEVLTTIVIPEELTESEVISTETTCPFVKVVVS